MNQLAQLVGLAKESPVALILAGCLIAIASLYRSERRSYRLVVDMAAALKEMAKAVSVSTVISEEQMDYLSERAPRRAARVRAKIRAMIGDKNGGDAAVGAPKGAAQGSRDDAEGQPGGIENLTPKIGGAG